MNKTEFLIKWFFNYLRNKGYRYILRYSIVDRIHFDEDYSDVEYKVALITGEYLYIIQRVTSKILNALINGHEETNIGSGTLTWDSDGNTINTLNIPFFKDIEDKEITDILDKDEMTELLRITLT